MNETATTPIDLRAGDLHLALRADLGGCIAGLWLGDTPVLRSVEASTLDTVRHAASYPLVPYSNRLAYRRFDWLGKSYTTAANTPGPHSIHGVGWQRPWALTDYVHDEAVLACTHAPDENWPFAFHAEQRLQITGDSLRIEMTVRNDSPHPAPVGLGWHPFFPKRERSRLHVEISDRWERDPTLLPTRRVAQTGIDSDVSHLDFDHCFDGWRGPARIRDEKLALKLTSSLDRLVVYTPPNDPYFAVEPVSHVNNAIHMAEPAKHGLRIVAPGETTSAWMALDIARV
jgi:aldose 1-epimerase